MVIFYFTWSAVINAASLAGFNFNSTVSTFHKCPCPDLTGREEPVP